MKTVVTITGIRPDFIRMSEIFKKLDENFNHVLIHSGQHYDNLLSEVFFDELEIRKPDYNLGIGGKGKPHYYQTSELSVKIIELLNNKEIEPDIILFLGDSNSVCCSVPLKKEGYIIGHIEAGMRSYDRRMLEEINRVVCDHCSDYLFVYHEDYKQQALREGIPEESIFVVGNTIVEVVYKIAHRIKSIPKRNDHILMDIHRPENFNYPDRMIKIIDCAKKMMSLSGLPVKMLSFKRTMECIEYYGIDLGEIEVIPLMSYNKFMEEQYHAKFLISDSGTAQEEPSLVGTPVLVPREFTERPQSVENHCSYMMDIMDNDICSKSYKWIESRTVKNDMSSDWLGEGDTADRIIHILQKVLR